MSKIFLFRAHKYKLYQNDQKYYSTHWGYDLGAKDMTVDMSEELELFAICSKFSRLIIDPNRSLISDTLIRKYIEKDIELEMNTLGK